MNDDITTGIPYDALLEHMKAAPRSETLGELAVHWTQVRVRIPHDAQTLQDALDERDNAFLGEMVVRQERAVAAGQRAMIMIHPWQRVTDAMITEEGAYTVMERRAFLVPEDHVMMIRDDGARDGA